jgi:hypothetical protein
MKKLLLCGAVSAALIPAASADAAKIKPLKNCKDTGLGALVDGIQKRGISCGDTRVVIRSVEAHGAQCRPYRQATIAPFRECIVTPVLSVGARNFFCRSAWEEQGDNKRWWRTTCQTGFKDVVTYRRDGNAR